jgi:dephospho-CoA kinase
MKPIVVGFAGSIASGKSTLSIEVASSLEWQRVSFGDYVRTVAQSQGLGDSREMLQAVGASLINQGMEQFCKAVLYSARSLTVLLREGKIW